MKTKTFARHIFSQTVWLSASLFVAFLFILLLLSFQVTETTISSLSELEARTLKNSQNKALKPYYLHWEDIPLKYKKLFNFKEAKEGVMVEKMLKDEGKMVYLYTYINMEGKVNYLLSVYNEKDIKEITDDIFMQSLSSIALTTLFIFLLLFLILQWLINRTAQPYKNLHEWIKTIQKSTIQREKIDFSVLEINNIALELKDKIVTIEQYAKREKEFLKHVSHELRTPLFIIQASLDTLNELNTHPLKQKILNRALKANNNIKITSSALLYLARESNKPIKKTLIKIEPFVQEIIEDHRYLLNDKKVQIEFTSLIEEIKVEEEFFFIIISNLIKNAFTYTEEGMVKVHFSEHLFSVENSISKQQVSSKEVSFSLGLKLVELICQKLSYCLEIKKDKNNFLVKILWRDNHSLETLN